MLEFNNLTLNPLVQRRIFMAFKQIKPRSPRKRLEKNVTVPTVDERRPYDPVKITHTSLKPDKFISPPETVFVPKPPNAKNKFSHVFSASRKLA
jgi:hypothetical protein